MSAVILSVLDDVAMRLADPRQWLQGAWQGQRLSNGEVRGALLTGGTPNCWCLSQAVTIATERLACGTLAHVTELRSDVERELLETVATLYHSEWSALHIWNDDAGTSHADVMRTVNVTRERLRAWANEQEAQRLAVEDARAGRDPQILTGELADDQLEYDTRYSAELARIADARASN